MVYFMHNPPLSCCNTQKNTFDSKSRSKKEESGSDEHVIGGSWVDWESSSIVGGSETRC